AAVAVEGCVERAVGVVADETEAGGIVRSGASGRASDDDFAVGLDDHGRRGVAEVVSDNARAAEGQIHVAGAEQLAALQPLQSHVARSLCFLASSQRISNHRSLLFLLKSSHSDPSMREPCHTGNALVLICNTSTRGRSEREFSWSTSLSVDEVQVLGELG